MRDNLHRIEGEWSGRLFMAPRPRGGDWLEDEIRSWKRSGIEVLISLLTPEEESELELTKEHELAKAQGLEFVAFPIEDRGVPDSAHAFLELIDRASDWLRNGKTVLVHCRQGIGRAGMAAVACLLDGGLTANDAISHVATSRGCQVPETPDQRRWIEDLAGSLYRRAA